MLSVEHAAQGEAQPRAISKGKMPSSGVIFSCGVGEEISYELLMGELEETKRNPIITLYSLNSHFLHDRVGAFSVF